jgi:tetraacyldisaccharide 4'-kinase
LLPFSILYSGATLCIRLSYQYGLKRKWRAPIPIIIIGNLTAGGSGKTPLVIWLARLLKYRNLKVGVVSRGYGGRSNSYPILVTGHSSPEKTGDEPVMIAQRACVPIAVSPKRQQAVEILLKRHKDLDLIISDDGLQHYALERDMEIIVVDGINRFGNGFLIPAGPMRTKLSYLKKADAIIINGGKAEKGEINMFMNSHDAINLYTNKSTPLHKLNNIVAIAGICHPIRFFKHLHDHGIYPESELSFPDHYKYSSHELRLLLHSSQTLLMTEKDAVKCRSFAQENWWYLPIEAKLYDYNYLLETIEKLVTNSKITQN